MKRAKENVHPVERRISAALGGALMLKSLTRRSLTQATLATALLYRGITGHSFLYQMLDISTAPGGRQREAGAPEIKSAITIEKPADELYRLWRDPHNLSRILGDFAEVSQGSDNRMHWRVQSPFMRTLEWDTEIVEERPGEIIRWQSLPGAQLPNEGSVSFRRAPEDWGTEVALSVRLNPPGGKLGKVAAKRLHTVPFLFAEKILRRFKSLADTGEIPTLKRNPSARVAA